MHLSFDVFCCYRGLSKKWGEQAAAVVCLRYLGRDDGRKNVKTTQNGTTQPVRTDDTKHAACSSDRNTSVSLKHPNESSDEVSLSC